MRILPSWNFKHEPMDICGCDRACRRTNRLLRRPGSDPPETPAPDKFVENPVGALQKAPRNASVDLAEWWKSLRDPELNSLISRAIESNLDIEIALTRIQEARTEEFVIIGESLPASGATGGGGVGTGTDLTRSRASPDLRSAENNTNLKRIQEAGGFDADWELDFFGKFAREYEAVAHDAESLAAARDWVIVTVAADVARAYLDMRALQGELAALRKNIDVAKGGLDLATKQFQQGLTNELDVALAQRQLATLQADIAPLEGEIAASRHVIAVFLGLFPEDLAKELATTRPDSDAACAHTIWPAG